MRVAAPLLSHVLHYTSRSTLCTLYDQLSQSSLKHAPEPARYYANALAITLRAAHAKLAAYSEPFPALQPICITKPSSLLLLCHEPTLRLAQPRQPSSSHCITHYTRAYAVLRIIPGRLYAIIALYQAGSTLLLHYTRPALRYYCIIPGWLYAIIALYQAGSTLLLHYTRLALRYYCRIPGQLHAIIVGYQTSSALLLLYTEPALLYYSACRASSMLLLPHTEPLYAIVAAYQASFTI
ncbi:Hypothetical predicted protein [Pelobates cultripes]|uniref:Uncharacterized protein n=1 Tax=Pelobates cultripes TaxID=61616 RepID=A0AAD1WSZ0_PELCU|nr:Hypothetical predicted protein [Pelobates cultripes]